eukprot:5614487-Prymnesium_polylepis.2
MRTTMYTHGTCTGREERKYARAGQWSSSRGVSSRTDARRGSGHRPARGRVETPEYHLKVGTTVLESTW